MPINKHAIFLFHGMGKYGSVKDGKYTPDTDGWFKSAETFLNEQYDAIVRPTVGFKKSEERRFVIVPINYDGTFEKFRTAWAEQAEQWSQLRPEIEELDLVAGSGIDNLVGGLQKLFSGIDDDNNFLWTHLADAALYLLSTVRNQVRADVKKQVADALVELPDDVNSWNILAHSLGTLVVNDLLHDLASNDFQSDYPHIMPPSTVCMLSNVSQLLTRDHPNIYASRIMPQTNGSGPGFFMSFSHQYDVLAQLEPFDAKWGTRYINETHLTDIFLADLINDETFESKEWSDRIIPIGGLPHEFSHYLKQQDVFGYFWSHLLGKEGWREQLTSAARAHYNDELRSKIKEKLKSKAEEYLEAQKVYNYFSNGKTLKALSDAIKEGLF